jgi:hypothetical protein
MNFVSFYFLEKFVILNSVTFMMALRKIIFKTVLRFSVIGLVRRRTKSDFTEQSDLLTVVGNGLVNNV